MNYKLFFDSVVAAGKTLGTGWSYKAAATAIMVLLLNKHAVLFYAFSLLVFVDCFTKWVAISYAYLKAQGVADPGFLKSVIGYLTATELLSIVENLNAAGVEAVQGLINTIKKKRM